MVQTYFDKRVMGDLDQVLSKEYLVTSNSGLYAASSLCNCNRRKYHGLLIAPQPGIDDENHLLVSRIDETIIIGEKPFAIAMHKYPNLYYPEDHRYIKKFFGQSNP